LNQTQLQLIDAYRLVIVYHWRLPPVLLFLCLFESEFQLHFCSLLHTATIWRSLQILPRSILPQNTRFWQAPLAVTQQLVAK
jgi:hypothetical protein